MAINDVLVNGEPVKVASSLNGETSNNCKLKPRDMVFKGGSFECKRKLSADELKLFRMLDSKFLQLEMLTAFAEGEEKTDLIKKGFSVVRQLNAIIGEC